MTSEVEIEAAVAAAKRRALASPLAPEAWAALAAANLAGGRTEAALAAYDAGLSRSPAAAGLLFAKGDLLRRLGRSGEAASALGEVLRLDPRHAQASLGLALLAIEGGDWDAAAGWADRLGAAADGSAQGLWLRARVALGRRRYAEAAPRLREVLSRADLSEAQRADTLLLLSQAEDGRGEWAAAFEAAAAGKAIQRRLYAPLAAGREDVVARLRRLETWFRGADPAAWRAAPDSPPDPSGVRAHVFLVGFPRSGTTLLEQALAGHPDIRALEEAPTLAAAHEAFLTDPAGLERLARLTPEEAARWRAQYWAVVAGRGVEAAGRVFVDKAPAATEELPLVAKLFPAAKILFAVRDPRDVVLSCFRQDFRMNAMTYAFTDLAATADCYDACLRLAEVYRALLPLPVLEVRHEALLDDFAGGLAAICDFIGLPFDPAMIDVEATSARRQVRTPSASQVRAGVNRQGVARWRSYQAELAPVLPKLQPWVERLGYGD